MRMSYMKTPEDKRRKRRVTEIWSLFLRPCQPMKLASSADQMIKPLSLSLFAVVRLLPMVCGLLWAHFSRQVCHYLIILAPPQNWKQFLNGWGTNWVKKVEIFWETEFFYLQLLLKPFLSPWWFCNLQPCHGPSSLGACGDFSCRFQRWIWCGERGQMAMASETKRPHNYPRFFKSSKRREG